MWIEEMDITLLDSILFKNDIELLLEVIINKTQEARPRGAYEFSERLGALGWTVGEDSQRHRWVLLARASVSWPFKKHFFAYFFLL